MEKIYTTKEILEMFGITRSTLWRWQKEGRFPKPITIAGGRNLYPESIVADYIESLKEEGWWNADNRRHA